MLSKTDKNKYRSLLFRHLDGISLLGPISQLSKTGISEFINKSDSFTLEDINSFKKCNLGYMNISLHLFLCQGWLRKESDIYYKTNKGNTAFQNLSYYAEIYEHVNHLVNCNSLIFNKSEPNNYMRDILNTIKRYPKDDQIHHHLTGAIIGPVLVAIGMSPYHSNIVTDNKLNNLESLLNDNTYKNIVDLFSYLEWMDGDVLTEKGMFYIKRASAYGVTTSYLPIYSFMETILFDNVNGIWKKIDRCITRDIKFTFR